MLPSWSRANYPSIELINFLEKNRVKYLFRLSSNDYKKERELMITEDESVKLMHTNPRLTKIKKNHLEIVEELREKKYTSTRIILYNIIQDVLHSSNKNILFL